VGAAAGATVGAAVVGAAAMHAGLRTRLGFPNRQDGEPPGA